MSKDKLLIPLGKRISAPFEAISGDLARHHGIAYNKLRDIFNFLINNEITEIETSDRKVISNGLKNYLTFIGISSENILLFFREIQKTFLDQSDEDNRLRLDFIKEIHITASWPGWNIVIGPKERADDAEDESEDFHLMKHVPNNRKKVYEKALEMIRAYESYANDLDNLIKKKLFERSIESAVNSLPNLLSARKTILSPLEFDERHWVAEPVNSPASSSTRRFFRMALQGTSSPNESIIRPVSR